MDITSYLLGKEAGGGGGSATLQNNKNVTISSNGTTVVNPDEGYDGLKKATITTNVQPTGTLNISANGTYDVTNYASANVSVGGQPTKGVVYGGWNSDGYPTEATVIGMTKIPGYYFYSTAYTQYNIEYKSLNFQLERVVIPQNVDTIELYAFNGCRSLEEINLSNVTAIGKSAFSECHELSVIGGLNNSITRFEEAVFNGCNKLALSSLPSNTTVIGGSAFLNCHALTIEQIPDGVTNLYAKSFANCKSLKKISMNNIASMDGGSAYNASFYGCLALKQAWIGSAITTTGLGRYAFYGCSSLEKIYIDKPRATVEAMNGYSYAFMNDTSKTGIIVCNDDPGFIDKATFDALPVE